VGFFPYKKLQPGHPLSRSPALAALLLLFFLPPPETEGQLVFGWPIRAVPHPEAVVTGAAALFWNPGSLSEGAGTRREFWIAHIDGPDATGIRGLAVSGISELPLRLRLALGYSHLGISDIPRTSTSPAPEPGDIRVSEDVAVLGLARELDTPGGIGAAVRFQRGDAAGDVRSRVEGDVGIHLRPAFPLRPRIGFSLLGIGGQVGVLGGLELTLPALASARLPLRLGYGIQSGRGSGSLEQRFSIRGSWLDQFHAGMGATRWGAEDGWTTLWNLGVDIGRYSISVLREELANGFGAVHFYRAAIRSF
jgi:hypothetical protein